MLVCDNRGHEFLRDICDKVDHLMDDVDNAGGGDVWIYDDGKSVPALKYEIKFMSDFLNRLKSDTLNIQLNVDGIILIGESDRPYWTFEKLQDVINGVEDHTRVYRVNDILQLERFLRLREEKVKDGTFGVIIKRKAKTKGYPPIVEALTNIDKVSYKIATRVYEAFDNWKDMISEADRVRKGEVTLEESRFTQIDKVGPVLARRIVDWTLQAWPKKYATPKVEPTKSSVQPRLEDVK